MPALPSKPLLSYNCRHALDGKGRLTIPARWREGISEFHLSPYRRLSDDGEHVPVLTLLTDEELQRRLEAIQTAPSLSQGQRNRLTMIFMGQVATSPMDSANRVLLPADMIQKFRLNGEVQLVGVGEFIQLWRPEDYDSFIERHEASLDDPAGDEAILAALGA